MWLEGKVAPINGDSDGKGEDIIVDVENETSSTTTTEVNKPSSSTTLPHYTLAKKAPFPNTPVDQLMSDYGAMDFIPALTSFLLENIPQCKITPSQFDQFDVFKQIIINLPPNFYLSNQPWTSYLRGTPPVKLIGRKSGTPGCFDTALITQAREVQQLGHLQVEGAQCRYL